MQIENQRMIVFQVGDHVSFVPETGSLMFNSVHYDDSGDYLCIVNTKRENGLVRFLVQGKFRIVCLWLFGVGHVSSWA